MKTLNEAIFEAVKNNKLDELMVLLDLEGADLNAKSNSDWRPLHLACYCNNKKAVELLLNKGAGYEVMNATIRHGWTPLHFACQNGYKEIVQLLLAHDSLGMVKDSTSLVNAKDDDGLTPLYLAAAKGYKEVVQLLLAYGFTSLEKGANVNACNIFGITPLQCARKFGHKEVVELLEQHIKKLDEQAKSDKMARLEAENEDLNKQVADLKGKLAHITEVIKN